MGKPLSSGCNAQDDEAHCAHAPKHTRGDEDCARDVVGGLGNQLTHPSDEDQNASQEDQADPELPHPVAETHQDRDEDEARDRGQRGGDRRAT